MTWKLFNGLKSEGFEVELLTLGGRPSFGRASIFYSDFRLMRRLSRFDAVIYMGSIASPSYLSLKIVKLLFIHGFFVRETIKAITTGPRRHRLGAVVDLSYWNFTRLVGSIGYVCHSVTASEENDLRRKPVLLPQFVLPDEIRHYESLRGAAKPEFQPKTRLLTYTSFADSPRLMTFDQMCALSRLLEARTSKDFELVVIDPLHPGISLGKVRTIPFVPRDQTIPMLNSSAVFLERCLDEEIGLMTLEAAMLGVPIAKLTLPSYASRQDYSEDDFLLAASLPDLAAKLAAFIEHPEPDYERYSTQSVKFATRVRTWDKVKVPLIALLRGENQPGVEDR